jgi:hypothetical protein
MCRYPSNTAAAARHDEVRFLGCRSATSQALTARDENQVPARAVSTGGAFIAAVGLACVAGLAAVVLISSFRRQVVRRELEPDDWWWGV